MLAHDQGGNMNASKIAANLNVSSVTIGRYTDLFVDLLLVRKLLPYSANVKKTGGQVAAPLFAGQWDHPCSAQYRQLQ